MNGLIVVISFANLKNNSLALLFYCFILFASLVARLSKQQQIWLFISKIDFENSRFVTKFFVRDSIRMFLRKRALWKTFIVLSGLAPQALHCSTVQYSSDILYSYKRRVTVPLQHSLPPHLTTPPTKSRTKNTNIISWQMTVKPAAGDVIWRQNWGRLI